MTSLDLLDWLREQCAEYEFDVAALYRRRGDHAWPLTTTDEEDLERQLEDGGHFLPLPKEPAALANIIEVSVVDYLIERAESDARARRRRAGPSAATPTWSSPAPRSTGSLYAVDVKVARRGPSGRRTQSRITLYTGNTYFRFPQLHWPGTFRPFEDYARHLDADLHLHARGVALLARLGPRADRSGDVADRVSTALVDDARVPRRGRQHRGAAGRRRRVRERGGLLPLLAAIQLPDRTGRPATARSTARRAARTRRLAAASTQRPAQLARQGAAGTAFPICICAERREPTIS